jgi:hypothetical protein
MARVAEDASPQEPGNGRWIAGQCLARPDLVSRVEKEIRDPYNKRGIQPLCTWEDWHRGMRLLERELRQGSYTFTVDDYRQASAVLKAQGHPFAGPLYLLGSYAGRVASYRESWGQRYASRAPTADEMTAAQLIAEGHVRTPGSASWAGIDGTRYAPALQSKPGKGGWRHVVAAENSADGVELVSFPGQRAAQAWLHNRARGTSGPLATSQTGPRCRVAYEDEVLAWLTHAPHQSPPWDLLGQVAWTSHLRAEIYRAAELNGRSAPPAESADLVAWRIRTTFTYWIPFVPGWAADEIGWPDAQHAKAYFDRLAMTPVSQSQALEAAEALAHADAEAAERARPSAPATVTAAPATEAPVHRVVPAERRRPVEPGPQRAQSPVRQPRMQPPPRQARRTGPEPR